MLLLSLLFLFTSLSFSFSIATLIRHGSIPLRSDFTTHSKRKVLPSHHSHPLFLLTKSLFLSLSYSQLHFFSSLSLSLSFSPPTPGWRTEEESISSVVSIHNAVNEECWRRILQYEKFHERFSACVYACVCVFVCVCVCMCVCVSACVCECVM